MFSLVSRAAAHVCPPVVNNGPVHYALKNSHSFRQLALIASGACTALVVVLSVFLILSHALHYSIPREQKHIIRIACTPPFFAVICMLCIGFEVDAKYLMPMLAPQEAFSFASVYMLLSEFLRKNDTSSEKVFAKMGKSTIFNFVTVLIFQFPVVACIIFLVTEITQATGRFCAQSKEPYFAKIWVTVVPIISTVFAMMAILRFYAISKSEIVARRPFGKLLAFKCIVFLLFIQNFVFSLLASSGKLKPSKYHSTADLVISVPAMLICFEMVFFSIAFCFVYTANEYKHKLQHQSAIAGVPAEDRVYYGGPLGIFALLQAINISDILVEIVRTLLRLVSSRSQVRE